ncbi:MAG: glycosyl transferase [Ekhidna sp.]|nr:glycosyl transferase [Ekhidna sp.]
MLKKQSIKYNLNDNAKIPSKKVLIITYYWPPSGGVGVQRWMNYVLQLKKRGWEPIILTPENPQFEIRDEKQTARVAEIPVYKIPIREPFNFFHKLTGDKKKGKIQQGLVLENSRKSFVDKISVWIRGNLFIPDSRVFWIRSAAKKANEIIQKEGINLMITTGPPHSIHLIGRNVKRKTGVKWLADFRDPWSKWDILKRLKTSALSLYFHERLEQSVINEANMVSTVSKQLAESFGKAEVLYNGMTMPSDNTSQLNDEVFVIGYFGMLNELRNPAHLWMTLDQLCREDPDFAKKLKIRIAGIVAESIKHELNKFKWLKGKVAYLGYLSHNQILNEYKKCNLLLLLLNKSDNSKWILPVKFFEYLAAHRMILCLGEKGSDLEDLINGLDIGEIFSYSDVQQIRAFIIANFRNITYPNVSDVDTLLKRFSHERLADKLEELLIKMK